MLYRRLGRTGPVVSAVSLGSWRTFETMDRDDAVAVMRAARRTGITFLDDARYNDETGRAPIPSGWSEVVFGEVFRAAGWDRDAVVVANKLWWEFWPQQDAVAELGMSLRRMALERVDLIYAERRPAGLPVRAVVEMAAGLLERGMAAHWGLLNWSAADTAECAATAARLGLPGPVATQLPYSAARPGIVESPEMTEALEQAGMSVVASAVLGGGLLTGKYLTGPGRGRLAGQLDSPRLRGIAGQVPRFAALARSLDVAPAALAIAFALSQPNVGSVLLGATTPAQLEANVAAGDLAGQLDAATLDRARACFR